MGVQSKNALPVLSPWGKAAAGSLAAMAANILVYPLDLAKTRLQVQTRSKNGEPQEYKDTFDVIRKVYASSGLAGLYAGLGGTLLGVASTNFAYFYWYSLIRGSYTARTPGVALSTATELLLGALAGALAQLFTIPVSVITTKQQTAKRNGGFFETAAKVLDEDGITGLWRGLKASLILVVNPSITYGSSSRLRTLLFGAKEHLSVADNFFLGALSKAIATIVTQPMIVAKVMQQSAEKEKDGSQGDKPRKPVFHTFNQALAYLYKNEGFKGLFKGLGPQISKGILVQGILLSIKDKVELWLVLLLQVVRLRLSGVAPAVI